MAWLSDEAKFAFVRTATEPWPPCAPASLLLSLLPHPARLMTVAAASDVTKTFVRMVRIPLVRWLPLDGTSPVPRPDTDARAKREVKRPDSTAQRCPDGSGQVRSVRDRGQ